MTRRQQMKKDFEVVAQWAQLSDETKKVAWRSAVDSGIKAAKCYAAIVNSLRKEN